MPIYEDRFDQDSFMELLDITRDQKGLIIHAFCLMTNHFHILVSTSDTEVWKAMSFLLANYAKSFNYRHGFTGHLFDSRYASGLVEDYTYFLEVSRYIHLNPVKARMVDVPLDYTYSSYGYYVSDAYDNLRTRNFAGIAGMVNREKTYSCFRGLTPSEEYRRFVEGNNSHKEQELLIQKEMREDDNWLPW